MIIEIYMCVAVVSFVLYALYKIIVSEKDKDIKRKEDEIKRKDQEIDRLKKELDIFRGT